MTDDQVAVMIIHGDIENEAEMRGLQACGNSIKQWLVRTEGTNDTTTYVLDRAGVTTLMHAVRANRRSWWRIQMTGQATIPT